MSHTHWPPRANFAPPDIDLDRFQKELTGIAGLSPNGLPILRLVWGQSERQIFEGRERMKYIFSSTEYLEAWEISFFSRKGKIKRVQRLAPSPTPPSVGRGGLLRPVVGHTDIGIPRWMIEQWFPPEIACADWEDERWAWVSGERVDVLGPAPREGLYMDAFYTIAEHRDECCRTAQSKRWRCFGHYRAPARIDIEYASAVWQMNLKEPHTYSWTEVPPTRVVRQVIKERYREIREESEKRRVENRRRMFESMRSASGRLCSEGHGLDTHKYKDIGPTLAKLRTNASDPNAYSPEGK